MVDAPVFNGGNWDSNDGLDAASTADDASDAESEATSSAASRGIAMNGDGEIGEDGRTEDPTVTIDVPLNLTDEVPEAGPSRSRKTIWTDPSDELIQVDLTQMPRLRKLGRGTKGGRINGLELEKRLRQQRVFSIPSEQPYLICQIREDPSSACMGITTYHLSHSLPNGLAVINEVVRFRRYFPGGETATFAEGLDRIASIDQCKCPKSVRRQEGKYGRRSG